MSRSFTTGTILFFALFAGAFFSGCRKPKLYRNEFSVRIGEFYQVNHRLRFQIDSLNDYRCPKAALCLWAGNVNVYFSILDGLRQTDTMVQLHAQNNPFDLAGYRWNIVAVEPFPEMDYPIKNSDKRVVLQITKN